MSEDGSEVRWIDVEAVARILGVSGRSIRRACERGTITRWRRVGFGLLARRKYQVTLDEVSSLYMRGAFHGTRLDISDISDISDRQA